MSFGRDFQQSPMNSFVFKNTPMKATTAISATPLSNNNHDDNDVNMSNNHNDNERKATKYDYLDYGNYLNRLLSSQCLTDCASQEINWNFPRTSDKVNVINAMLAIFESKKLYQTLLQQSRDTIESMKIEIHSTEMKLQAVHQKNKELNSKMNAMYQRKEYLEKELKKQTQSMKEKNKSLTKEIEQLKYRDKKYQNDIRKKEKIHKSQQEKIKKLLDERDKKSYKCLGFKLLNGQSSTTSMLNHSNSSKSISTEQHNRLLEENNMLQTQIAHFQKQLQTILAENNLLRESLLKLEVNCKDALMKINDLFANNSNTIQSIHGYKYAMPFNKDTHNLVANDIQQSVSHLLSVLDGLKMNIDQTNNAGNIQKMKSEIARLQNTVQELEESNKEYETLIRTYVNSE